MSMSEGTPYNLKQGGVADRYLSRNEERHEGIPKAASAASKKKKKASKPAKPAESPPEPEDKHVWQPTRANWVPDDKVLSPTTAESGNGYLPVSPPDPATMEDVQGRVDLPFHTAWVEDRKVRDHDRGA